MLLFLDGSDSGNFSIAVGKEKLDATKNGLNVSEVVVGALSIDHSVLPLTPVSVAQRNSEISKSGVEISSNASSSHPPSIKSPIQKNYVPLQSLYI